VDLSDIFRVKIRHSFFAMQSCESIKKSVKLLISCLFSILGSGKPFPPNKHEHFTPLSVNLRILSSEEILPDFRIERIRATAQLFIIQCFISLYFYVFLL